MAVTPAAAMAATAPSSNLSPSSPYFLRSSDQPGAALVSPPLDGDNYPTWNRAMIMALEAKNKLSFVDGSLCCPDPSSPDHPHWVRCNSMVRSWIVHSTISSIAHSILWHDTTFSAWTDLRERFSPKNAPRIFEIRRALSTHVQGTDSLSSYYTAVKGYRDGLLSYRALPNCICGALKPLQDFLETDYLMDFLQGLNDSYVVVRSQILLMDPLPSINKAYALLLQEERQRSLHLVRPTVPD
ncbi:uncharacterized protein LOC122643573 [Telopea speciosissima]|uniref:uncharacterized protein LOC122643573 n=1 Tax=Telopea speciosissima TaxID=54955 RepID=UPI001CC482BB|nr:uncharacterized protein LOC122643573 [Telopea speciosissima]